ncbi:helix-turn-helix transcriptional regulator [Planotetraspora phitsanulokensis]|uniref:Transcriptional regulator n=1 Tax=Planotetraspora phitsanulokensis TaxID=575192 RepID=A0A8J3U415_9ACTN|nr:transcriptional regulator [Planotetraspora phitsanulokensis]
MGLPHIDGRRRTPGLRRDEVAVLAGLSIDYYTRLEQGRERHPSAQVLNALAQVLQLGPEATEYLHELAHPRACKRGPIDQVNPTVAQLGKDLDHLVVFTTDRRMDVPYRNPLAAALHGWLKHSDNMIRMHFLDPAAREFYLDWEREARFRVAHVRAATGVAYGDRQLLALVDELSAGSEDFRRIWDRHDVRVRTNESIRYRHPEAGEMTLLYETFAINSTPGQNLVIGRAQPGSPSEHALCRLRALAAARG